MGSNHNLERCEGPKILILPKIKNLFIKVWFHISLLFNHWVWCFMIILPCINLILFIKQLGPPPPPPHHPQCARHRVCKPRRVKSIVSTPVTRVGRGLLFDLTAQAVPFQFQGSLNMFFIHEIFPLAYSSPT